MLLLASLNVGAQKSSSWLLIFDSEQKQRCCHSGTQDLLSGPFPARLCVTGEFRSERGSSGTPNQLTRVCFELAGRNIERTVRAEVIGAGFIPFGGLLVQLQPEEGA